MAEILNINAVGTESESPIDDSIKLELNPFLDSIFQKGYYKIFMIDEDYLEGPISILVYKQLGCFHIVEDSYDLLDLFPDLIPLLNKYCQIEETEIGLKKSWTKQSLQKVTSDEADLLEDYVWRMFTKEQVDQLVLPQNITEDNSPFWVRNGKDIIPNRDTDEKELWTVTYLVSEKPRVSVIDKEEYIKYMMRRIKEEQEEEESDAVD